MTEILNDPETTLTHNSSSSSTPTSTSTTGPTTSSDATSTSSSPFGSRRPRSSPELRALPAPEAHSLRGQRVVDGTALTAWLAAEEDRSSALIDADISLEDLAALPMRQLRVLANKAYALLDTDYPPMGAADCYQLIADEIGARAQRIATHNTVPTAVRETFRDNLLYCRFELFSDGDLAVYMKYLMHGANLVLVQGMEQPGFRDQGLDATLMRGIVLAAHKRRLHLVPRCPMASSFLAENPQYQRLAGLTDSLPGS